MATVITSSANTPPNGRLFTIADVDKMPRQLPSGPVDYELDNGRIVTMSPTGNRHSAMQTRLSKALANQGDDQGFGETRVEVGVILWRNPDRLVGPDVAFFPKKLFPLKESVEGYLETIPDLVFEVRSKNDTEAELRQKVADYLAAGVKQIFTVEPETKTIGMHRLGQTVVVLGESDLLKLDEIIPGFTLSLAELFRP
ncbi:MAG TPA: Uma2 family endonuclease [Pirellulales bacterium]|jgi:Uma2 family endonuclease